MRTQITAAGQAAANAAVMMRDDLNAPAGWTGGPQKPDLSPPAPCPGFHPKQSDIVRTGVAQSIFRDSSGISFDSEAQVVRSARMLRLDWKRSNVKDWNSVIGIQIGDEKEGFFISPRASRQSIDGTIKFLKDRSGFSAYLDKIGGTEDEPVAEEVGVEKE